MEKVKKIAVFLGIVLILLPLLFLAKSFIPKSEESPMERKVAVKVEPQIPLCLGPDNYEFPAGRKIIKVPLYPDCWSGWVSFPPGAKRFRIKNSPGEPLYALTWSGKIFSAGAGGGEEKIWTGTIARQNMRLRGGGREAIVIYE